MLKRVIAASSLAVLLATMSIALHAADEPKKAAEPSKKPAAEKYSKADADKLVFTDAANASPDFAVQGEYLGECDMDGQKQKIAAQIASLGGGNFNAAFYLGGLPGEGWDGKTRVEATGKAKDPAMTEVTFTPTGENKDAHGEATATWTGGGIKGKTHGGAPFVLRRAERKSPTLGAKPPEGATLLFDGTNVDGWEGGKMDDRKLLAAGARTKKKFK